jgi:ABC-type lipoprotein export system ATPase subunit
MKLSQQPKPSQQKVIRLDFDSLKNLKSFSIDFNSKSLTAILGPNGCGKSTIIHDLACCYQPIDETKSINYRFSYFFPPTTDSTWQGSRFPMTHSYRVGEKEYEEVQTKYEKQADRWKPIYKRRPSRYVSFIGIKTCVPKIEDESKQSLIQYSTQPLSDELSLKVKEAASFVMNRDSTNYNIHEATGRKYIGVEYEDKRYSSLSMGAGEQRIFFILTELLKAPKYSLILIDEIDILLHDDALSRLLKVLIDRADDKNLQIIFTTHAHLVINFSDRINIRHISQTVEKTLCFKETKPDSIYRLTGKQDRSLEVFVEDDLAKAIVKKICGELGLSKYVSIKEYGAVDNCFTVLAGMLLNNDKNIDNMLFVIDGDVYKTSEDQRQRMKSALTGTTPRFKEMRDKALDYICKFIIDNDFQPEKFLHSLIVTLPRQNSEEYNEIINVAKDIYITDDSHKYIDFIIERMDYERAVGLKVITDVIALSDRWHDFVVEVKDWLISKKEQINESIEP